MRKFGNGTAETTLYDGLSFEVIKQSPTFANGMFTDSSNTGIQWGKTGKPTGDRYRYISDEEAQEEKRYFYLEDNTYKTASSRYSGERTQISENGTLAAQGTAEGTQYFTTDLFGSVSTVSDSYGYQLDAYTYDVFGSLVQGDLSGVTDFGYLGKQKDSTSKLYNYGYRDYSPQSARFTTVDPVRDGTNWFAYVNNDPVNFVDLWGLELTLTVDKDSQMMTVEINTPNYTKRFDIPVTTHVVSDYNKDIADKSANTDTTREQDNKTNPTQFPNGSTPITSSAAVPSKHKGKYGDGWLTTDVTQSLPATDGSGDVIDSGYFIHYTTNTNTNGCIGVKNLSDMELLLELYDINKNIGDGKSTIIVKGGKKNK